MARISRGIVVATAVLLSSPAGAATRAAESQALPAVVHPVPLPTGPYLIFFDWNKAAIPPQAVRILNNVVATFQHIGRTRVLVSGYADRSGPSDYNIALSQRRADAVRDFLVRRGVPASLVVTEAKGESRLLTETIDGVSHPHNRRVEIYFPERPYYSPQEANGTPPASGTR
jgi:outer membrane protein OmpA-like peptidoglycan-associated protein